jgi:hypothetical protein
LNSSDSNEKEFELTHAKMKKHLDELHSAEDSGSVMHQIQMGADQVNEYEEQYNANHDFAIF